MSGPINHDVNIVQRNRQIFENAPQGQLAGRKVSNWQKAKDFLYDNRKAIAVALLIISIAAAATGLGFALTASLSAALILTATATTTGTLLSLTPTAALTLTFGVTLSAALKTIVIGSIVFLTGTVMTFGTGGFLAGTAINR